MNQLHMKLSETVTATMINTDDGNVAVTIMVPAGVEHPTIIETRLRDALTAVSRSDLKAAVCNLRNGNTLNTGGRR